MHFCKGYVKGACTSTLDFREPVLVGFDTLIVLWGVSRYAVDGNWGKSPTGEFCPSTVVNPGPV